VRYLTCFAVGYVASSLLREPTHRAAFPEIGRYAIGMCVVAIGMALGGVCRDEVERLLLLGGATGAGVAIARIMK
jgi:hypothetical protein